MPATPAPEAAPMPGADMAGGTFDPMGADPNIGAGIGNMAEDPNAGMPAEDPMTNGELDPNLGSDAEMNDDSTAGIIDQLSDDDKEAVRNYAKSLLNRDESSAPEEGGMEEPAQGQQGVMMEITKGRLKKVQQKLGETFRDNKRGEEKPDKKQKKVNKNRGKKSPFDSPLD